MSKFNKLNLLLIPSLFLLTSCNTNVTTDLSETDALEIIHEFKKDNIKTPNNNSEASWEIKSERTEDPNPTKTFIGSYITGSPVKDLKGKKAKFGKDVLPSYVTDLEKQGDDRGVIIAMNDTYYDYLRHQTTQGGVDWTLKYYRNGSHGIKIVAIFVDYNKKNVTYTHVYDNNGREAKFTYDFYEKTSDTKEESFTFTLNFKYDK